MQPTDTLPAAHLANVQAQAQIEAEAELPDVYVVNPGGRVVEVPGALAEKLLLENGYRRATDAEAEPHEKLKMQNHPAVLRKREALRVKAEAKAAEDYMKQVDSEFDDELTAQDKPAEQPSKPAQPQQPASPPTPAPGEQTQPSQPENGSDEGTPKPPSRAAKK